MKTNHLLKSFLLAAALLGAALATRAQETSPLPASGRLGLLGQTYAGLTYSYVNLHAASSHTDDYRFDYNQALKTGLDAIFSYDYLQGGAGTKQQDFLAGMRAYSNAYAWGRPYVEAGGGFAWEKVAGAKDNSFLWEVAIGTEFQVAPAVTVTPYIKYEGTPSLARRNTWDYGVKANYWVDGQWAVTAGLDRTNHQDMRYTVGTNWRF
jgi:hypothetical protein